MTVQTPVFEYPAQGVLAHCTIVCESLQLFAFELIDPVPGTNVLP